MNITITIEEDTVMDAVRKIAFKPGDEPTDAELEVWIKTNLEAIKEHLENYAIDGAVRGVAKPYESRKVEAPVLSFDNGKLELWVYDAEEHARVPVLGLVGNEWNGGLVYVEKNIGAHVIEHDLRNKSTWEWIQGWMEKGMRAEGALK